MVICSRLLTVEAAALLVLAVPFGVRSHAMPSDAEAFRWRAMHVVERDIPEPLAGHPGNIFLEGENVAVAVPAEGPARITSWVAVDDAGETVARGEILEKGGRRLAVPGRLGIGWYRIEFHDSNGSVAGWTTCAILARLFAPVPQNSPVCIDTAISWFAHGDRTRQAQFANLAALAGVNWIRDRIRMREIHASPDGFAAETTYDTAAQVAHDSGLKVLQVFHDTPQWAVDEHLDGKGGRGRFPRDLRIVYNYCRELSKRFHGRVQAWEPWNEANISVFGGHTVDEMCSFQKAAFLGFKAGNPNITVCWNAYAAVPMNLHTRGVIENVTWPYFETYNIHTYDWPHSYNELWRPAREASCGKPIWITEADRGMKYTTTDPWFDLSRSGELRKAELIPQSYATSLFAGATRHFHFILGHYTESNNQVQFGLLRRDLTPRPAYVALAATGRLLAGARCLGRWQPTDDSDIHIYAFRAQPDGRTRDVLVAWTEEQVDWPRRGRTVASWRLPPAIDPYGLYDYLGRWMGITVPDKLTPRPIFVLLRPGATDDLQLIAPAAVERKEGLPSPMVLQLEMPAETSVKVSESAWSRGYVHALEGAGPHNLTVRAYNFSDKTRSGRIIVQEKPSGCAVEPTQWDIRLAPGQRAALQMTLHNPVRSAQLDDDRWIRLNGRFESVPESTLAFQIYDASTLRKAD